MASDAPETESAEPLWTGESGAEADAPVRMLQSIPGRARPHAAGHRIVNGGKSFPHPVRITPEVRQALAALAPLAPKHNQLEMAGITAVDKIFGDALPQVAVFDSSFHATMPPSAFTYPGPYAWIEQGIRRFGFHGISYRYVSRRAARLLQRPLEDLKLVCCHLGAGCSLCAISGGRSIETTMGFTALEGLMMATRSGSVDPGLLVYLMRTRHFSPDDIDRILNQESGFKGLGGDADLRKVVSAAEGGDNRAQLAIDVFIHRLAAGIGQMLAALGGAHALVFTAGIGENSALVRERACRQFEFLGLKIDAVLNQLPLTAEVPERDIAAAESKLRILVIRTNEDWEIARQTRAALA